MPVSLAWDDKNFGVKTARIKAFNYWEVADHLRMAHAVMVQQHIVSTSLSRVTIGDWEGFIASMLPQVAASNQLADFRLLTLHE